MAIFLPHGISSDTSGDALVWVDPLLVSGNVWYVDTISGTDAASPAGLNAAAPLKTLSQAITNAANHDIILIRGTGSTTDSYLTSAVTVNKSVTIIGEETIAGEAGIGFARSGGASVNLLTISAADVQLRNLRFGPTITSAVATARIAVSAARLRIVGCTFESGEFDTGPALSLAAGADSCDIRSCTFESVSTTTQPESAIKSSAALTSLRMYGVTLNGGTVGYSNFYAADLSSGAVTRAEIERLSLLNGADLKLHASSTGWVNPEVSSGGSRVDW